MNTNREQLFIKEGVSKAVAHVAAVASYLQPNERTPEQQEAVHIVSQKIAENNQALSESDR
jgi:hypothetical protein